MHIPQVERGLTSDFGTDSVWTRDHVAVRWGLVITRRGGRHTHKHSSTFKNSQICTRGKHRDPRSYTSMASSKGEELYFCGDYARKWSCLGILRSISLGFGIRVKDGYGKSLVGF